MLKIKKISEKVVYSNVVVKWLLKKITLSEWDDKSLNADTGLYLQCMVESGLHLISFEINVLINATCIYKGQRRIFQFTGKKNQKYLTCRFFANKSKSYYGYYYFKLKNDINYKELSYVLFPVFSFLLYTWLYWNHLSLFNYGRENLYIYKLTWHWICSQEWIW